MSKLSEFFKKLTTNPNGKDIRDWTDGTIAFNSPYVTIQISEKGLLSIPEVFACIDLIANDVSKAKFYEKSVEYLNDVRTLTHVPNSKWDKILNRRPNEYMSKTELLKSAVFDLFLRGGFYWFIDVDDKGRPSEIIPIDPANIRQVKDEDDKWGYEITTWSGMTSTKDLVPYDCVIGVNYSSITRVNDGDFRYIYNSLLQQYGLKNKYDTSQLSRETTILAHAKLPDNVTDEQKNKIKENFKSFFTSADGQSSGVLVTDKRVEVDLLDGSKTSIKAPVDKDFVAMLFTKLANAFHIPLSKLNVNTSGNSAYKTREQMNIDYMNDAIDPILNLLVSKFNQVVFGSNMKKELVPDLSSLMDYDTATRGEYSAKMRQNAIMTTNELRNLNGLPPIEGGNTLFGNGTLVELGKGTGSGNGAGSDNGGGDEDDEPKDET